MWVDIFLGGFVQYPPLRVTQLELLQLVICLEQSFTSRTFDISTELERTYSHARKTSTIIQRSLHVLFIFKVVLYNFRLRKA